MVKVIPWVTKCTNCNVQLEYENEDVLTKENEYYLYDNSTKITKKELYKELYHYIICPKCNGKVYLD